jgi:signal transduction histidine kinase
MSEMLKESPAHLAVAAFAAQLPEAVFIFDTARPGLAYANAALESLSGLTEAQLIEDFRAWLSRVHSEDLPIAAASGAWESDAPGQTVRYRYRHDTLGWRTFEARLFRIEGSDTLVGGLVRDLTEVIEAERLAQVEVMRQRSLGQFRAAADMLPVGLVLRVNAERFIANAFARRLVPELEANLPETFAAALEAPTDTRSTLKVRPGTPEMRRLEAVTHTVDLGTESLPLLTFTDDTARAQSEAFAQGWASERERLLRSLLVSEMAASIAHDLNQPLTAIQSWVEGVRMRLERMDLDHPGMKAILGALNEAAGQGRRAGDIVNRLRSFILRGEVEAGSAPLTLALERAARAFAHDGSGLHVVLPPTMATLPRVRGNPAHLEVVVVSLLRHLQPRRTSELAPAKRRVAIAEHGIVAGRLRLSVPDGLPAEGEQRVLSSAAGVNQDGAVGPHEMDLAVAVAAIESIGGRLSQVDREQGPQFWLDLEVADGTAQDSGFP